ncbi:MAG: hypothetical protein ACTSUR_01710 [Candidatus Heimdallarchaeaceae archaeon]
MKKKTRFLLTFSIITLVLVLSIYISLFYMFKQKNKKNQFIYPNSLWTGSNLSDLTVENDSCVHFCLTESKNSYDSNIIYVELDLKNNILKHIPRFPGSTAANFNQIKIKLDSLGNPVIYLHSISSFFMPVGELLIINNNSWKIHSAFRDLNQNISELARGEVLNWEINDLDFINIAFLFNPYGFIANDQLPEIITPTIYNESSNEVTFLSEIFSEVQTFYSSIPGDFKIINSNVVVLWERYEGVDNYTPYLAVNWFNETWQIYNLDYKCSTVKAITIVQDSNSFDIFTYSPGFIDNISSIYLTQFVNTSYFETKKIAEFQGNTIFYQDSIFKMLDGSYVFLYTRRTFNKSIQTDLFLSYYDGHNFVETQLTNTPNFVEYYAHAELGEEYLHYAWTQFDYDDDGFLNRETSQIFYNRIKISDIIKNDIHLQTTPNIEHVFGSSNSLNTFTSSFLLQIYFILTLNVAYFWDSYIEKKEVLEHELHEKYH